MDLIDGGHGEMEAEPGSDEEKTVQVERSGEAGNKSTSESESGR